MENRYLKTLKLIENIACEEGLSRTTFLRDENKNVTKVKSDKTIDLIYKLAHAGINECGNPHLNWQNELDVMIKSMDNRDTSP